MTHASYFFNPKKSENLLVDDNWNIKLCDFGFARAIESREKTRMTMCGSPYFNAPELLLGKAYNEKADVFAFGILLCEGENSFFVVSFVC